MSLVIPPDKIEGNLLNYDKNWENCKVIFFNNNQDYYLLIYNWLLELYNLKKEENIRTWFEWKSLIVDIINENKETLFWAPLEKVNVFNPNLEDFFTIYIGTNLLAYYAIDEKDSKKSKKTKYYIKNIIEEKESWKIQKVEAFTINKEQTDDWKKYEIKDFNFYIHTKGNNLDKYIFKINNNIVYDIGKTYNIFWTGTDKKGNVINWMSLQKVYVHNTNSTFNNDDNVQDILFLKINNEIFDPFLKEWLKLVDIYNNFKKIDGINHQEVRFYDIKKKKYKNYYIANIGNWIHKVEK